ncbi:MAG: hypothetical protein JWP75_2387 [Frondihabitans sp.]|nr:hypothetical protein [Frondihabitans sp.]
MTSSDVSSLEIAEGGARDVDACVALWLEALAARDGHEAAAGTAERCRGKFVLPRVAFPVLRDGAGELRGFSLVTGAGTGQPEDPGDAAYLSLLAVEPGVQGRGWGSRLLACAVDSARARGFPGIVLHVLTDHVVALHLYESRGWTRIGETFEHPLRGRPTATLELNLVAR